MEELETVSVASDSADAIWFEKAEDGIDFLIRNARSDEIVLYARFGFTLIHGFLVPEENVRPPDFDDLESCDVRPESTWALQHVSGGGPERMHLEAPLDGHNKSLTGGEKLIFERRFDGIEMEPRKLELSQRLIHALDLYWLDEYSAFCRLDEEGDIERVVQLVRAGSGDEEGWVVTILASDLHRYMAVAGMALVRRFDFTRYPKSFGGWSDLAWRRVREDDISYHAAVDNGASLANGAQIIRSVKTRAELIQEQNIKDRREEHKFESFIALNWRYHRIEELSCAPSALASYFQPDSPLPFQYTPVFFRPEVLLKYKSDPDKYSLAHRSISCRGGWSLQSYDVNEQGQVHTYLRYLGDLPHKEQLYWKSFNESPKGDISKRAIATDMRGDWCTIPDPLDQLRTFVRELDRSGVEWWKPRGDSLLATANYPVTKSTDEWAGAIMTLDQIVVEGLLDKVLQRIAKDRGVTVEQQWRSLKLLEALVTLAANTTEAAEMVKPLKLLHELRSKVKGHACGSEKNDLVKAAIKEEGSLKRHYEILVQECFKSFKKVLTLALGYHSPSDNLPTA